MQRSIGRRLIGLISVSLAAGAMTAVSTGSAHATGTPSTCVGIPVQYSLDGGATWSTDGRIDGSVKAPTKITVRLSALAAVGCSYPVSLAVYQTQGATWETSGQQKFLGMRTTSLSLAHPRAVLDASAFTPSCFGQIDLYANAMSYNGTANPLPHYPSSAVPSDLITVWNSKTPCASLTPTPTPTPTPSARSSSPAVAPTSPPGPQLARTGGDNSQLLVYGASGIALLALGAVVLARRGRSDNS
ncbi:LAETG motif-containing sortase-dependent surface protein [Streptomyces mirabilis]